MSIGNNINRRLTSSDPYKEKEISSSLTIFIVLAQNIKQIKI
jgi:hypothetical protein